MEPSPKPAARPLGPSELLGLLLEASEQLSSTLDLDELATRVAAVVKRAIDYRVFAILLLNEKTRQLRILSSVGHPPDVVSALRINVGEGIVGRAAESGRSVLINDVRKEADYIESLPSIRSELAVPLVIKHRVIGVVDLEAPWPGFFTEQHQYLLELLSSRIALAIENARLYRRSLRQSRTLQLLNEISRELSSVLVLKELLERIGALTKRLVNYRRFSILLADEASRTFNNVISLREDQKVPDRTTVRYGHGIVGAAAEARQPVLVPDVRQDPRYILVDPDARSELAVPLIYHDRVVGVVDLESHEAGYFNDSHIRIFSTLAPQIAIALENAQLYERVVRSEARLERDLQRAQEIQMRLMPGVAPAIPHLEVALRFQPARELGGDLYDFLTYGKDVHVLAIGDVSGKGAPAALYGAMASGILRSLAPQRLPPGEMLRKLNLILLERKIEGHFITLTYAVWEPKLKALRLANAGMPLPVLVRGGHCQPIRAEGVPLGLLEQVEYQEVSLTLEKGDVLALFSDGLTEAFSPQHEEFGPRRMENLLRENQLQPVEHIVDEVFKEVSAFEQGRPARDDQTMVVLRVR